MTRSELFPLQGESGGHGLGFGVRQTPWALSSPPQEGCQEDSTGTHVQRSAGCLVRRQGRAGMSGRGGVPTHWGMTRGLPAPTLPISPIFSLTTLASALRHTVGAQ